MHILAVSNHEVIEIVEGQSLLLNNVLAKCVHESRKNLSIIENFKKFQTGSLIILYPGRNGVLVVT